MIKEQLDAQISLLDDSDQRIFNLVRESIINKGESIIPVLEDAWTRSQTPIVHHRIEDIIHDIYLNDILDSVSKWVDSGAKDLFEILFLISKFYYQSINKEDLYSTIIEIKNDIWLELNDNLTAIEKIKVFNQIFFEKYKFSKTETSNKSLFFLSELLVSKKGNDMSVALLYLLVADLLDLPLVGLNLPGNFILAYRNENVNFEEEFLFYINPINKGMFFGQEIIDAFIKKNKLKIDDKFYKPVSNKQIIVSYIDELSLILEIDADKQKLAELSQIKKIIS